MDGLNRANRQDRTGRELKELQNEIQKYDKAHYELRECAY